MKSENKHQSYNHRVIMQALKGGIVATIWVSTDEKPLEYFRRQWPKHLFRTIVRVSENTIRGDEELLLMGYDEVLDQQQINIQFKILSKNAKQIKKEAQASTVHRKSFSNN